jgi:hypothetical protein
MEAAEPRGRSITPFLTRFAVPRKDEFEIPGRYEPSMHVWVIDGPAGAIPIVNSQTSLVELGTKTEVVSERDDPGHSFLPELATKTAVRRETDDFRAAGGAWELALETTTKIDTERIDR